MVQANEDVKQEQVIFTKAKLIDISFLYRNLYRYHPRTHCLAMSLRFPNVSLLLTANDDNENHYVFFFFFVISRSIRSLIQRLCETIKTNEKRKKRANSKGEAATAAAAAGGDAVA